MLLWPLVHSSDGSDVFLAHKDAVAAGRLHRDISAGNCLVCEFKTENGEIERRGMLNDWEFSKLLDDDTQRHQARTVSIVRVIDA